MMNKLKISKDNGLYKLFERIANSEFCSFIYHEDGKVNSFNDVCTFIKHCIYLAIHILMYLFLAGGVIIFAIFFIIMFFGLYYIAIVDTYENGFVLTSLILIQYPLIIGIWLWCIRGNSKKIDYDSGAFGKFIEIVSNKKRNVCVKIDVVEKDEV